MNITFNILGAGFSVEGGLPLVANFLNRMRDSHSWLISQGRTDEAEAVQRVLEFRLKATSASYWTKIDLENIEELFSLASIRESDDSLLYYVKRAIAATLILLHSHFHKKQRKSIFRIIPM